MPTWGVVASILGSLATIFGGIRWLLGVYFKQQLKLDTARKKAFAYEAELLRKEVSDMRSTFREHKVKLDELSVLVEDAIREFKVNTEQGERVYKAFREFLAAAKLRFERLEREHDIPQTAEVTQSEVQVKETPKTSVGKVIIKE